MGFIEEAELMLAAARRGEGQATRVGYLVLAKDTIAAAITEAKKGVKSQDGHTVSNGQTEIAVDDEGDGDA